MAKHPCFYGHLLLLPDYCQTLLGFLRSTRKQKLPISFGNQEFTANCFSSKWCHQESNRGHKDFQSFALPTELWHRCFSFAVAKVRILF